MHKHSPEKSPAIVAAILAGGESRRFNYQTKALVDISGTPMIDLCIQRLQCQHVKDIVVCANGNQDLANRQYPLINEASCRLGGPLRGLYSALQWADAVHPNTWLLTIPCDTPRLPLNLVQRLGTTLQLSNGDCVIAANHGRLHPTVGLWSTRVLPRLREHLQSSTNASLKHWLTQCTYCVLDFAAPTPDPFININSQADLSKLAP